MSCVGGWASNSAAGLQDLSDRADLITGLYGRDSVESERAINTYVMALHKMAAARTVHNKDAWKDRLRQERHRQRIELQKLIDRAHQRQSAAA